MKCLSQLLLISQSLLLVAAKAPTGPSALSASRASSVSTSGISHALKRRRGGGTIAISQEEEVDFIKKSLMDGFPFNDLPEDAIDKLVESFKKVEFKKGDTLFTEGDEVTSADDFMLVILEGKCAISIEGKPLPNPYGIMGEGSVLGELALLYDCERAATITAKTHVTAFRLNNADFKHHLRFSPNANKEDVKEELRKVDAVLDQIAGVKTRYGGDIIRQFKPMRFWIWKRWAGTIVQQAWKTAVFNMLISLAFSATMRIFHKPTWAFGMLPDNSDKVISKIVGLSKVWQYLMSVTTFILTFFLSQAYGVWREMYSTSRKIQGRMNDFGFLAATTAARDKDGRYTPQASDFLLELASFTRLFHALMWAAFAKNFNILCSDIGLRRMMSRGLLTRKQYNTLWSLSPDGGNLYNACLMWIFIRCLRAMEEGTLPPDPVLREQLYIKIQALRGTVASISDIIDGRIPLAYAHFVQILVDVFVILAPFALYAELGVWSTAAVGLLTLFYSGILDLSKILLDPLDNDDFYNKSVNMDMGVLIRESNAGSNRWMAGAEVLPF